MRKTVKTALLFSSAALIVACGGNNKKSENAMTDKNADKWTLRCVRKMISTIM